MGKALLIVFGVVLFVYAMFDLIATPSDRVRDLPKVLWFVILLLVPVGPLAWILWGSPRQSPPKPEGSGRTPPSGPRGPDDDPDYLRGL